MPVAFAALALWIALTPPGALAEPVCPGNECRADVSIVAPGMPETLRLGEATELQFVVRNAGPLTAYGVFFGTNFRVDLEIVSTTSDAGSCEAANGNASCQLGDIPAGDSVTVTISGRPTKVGQGEMIAHAYPGTGTTDGDQTNNEIDPIVEVLPGRGGVAKITPINPERILKTGGVRLRVVPHMTGALSIDGYVSTRGGRVALTHLDLRDATESQARSVFLGTTRAALARIRRALKTTRRLHAHIVVTAGGASSTTTVYVGS
jgi:hypothetical protein